jgi:glycosyltransferase involved in cell wall biosynthesis
VVVLALRTHAGLPAEEHMDGVCVLRIQDRFEKEADSPLAALRPLLRFTLAAARRLHALARAPHGDGPFDLVHVHNVPDFLAFAAWPARWRGARVILDLHDLVPEFYASRFTACERMSAAVADHVIVANDLWRDRVVRRSARHEACSVMLNHVDERVFRPRPRRRAFGEGGPLVLFPGGLQAHQGLDVAIRAFARLLVQRPDARLHLVGDGSEKPALQALVESMGLQRSIRFFAPQPLAAIAERMAEADLGIVPKLANGFGNEAYSTKILEFMAVGVPVVVSRTRIDTHYFDPAEVRFFDSGDDVALAQAMAQVLDDAGLRERLVEAGLARAARERWGAHRQHYFALVDALVANGRAPRVETVEAC